MNTVKIFSSSRPSLVINAGLCDTFYTKFMGFMFRKQIDPFYGLLFSESTESKVSTSIHMFFMNFDLAVLWLNKDFTVVDKAIARKWHPVYVSKQPAQYTLEMHTDRYQNFEIGDKLEVAIEG
jgi:uncharacterized membrane protein (UPF0127 family)